MTPAVVVAALGAGAVGALLRYGIGRLFAREPGGFPTGLLIVNTLGSAIGGGVLGLGTALDPAIALILLGGFAGGFTTFSTVAVETVLLAEEAERLRLANLSLLLQVVLGVAAAGGAFALSAAIVAA